MATDVSSFMTTVSGEVCGDTSDIAVMPDIMDNDDIPLMRFTKLVLEPLSAMTSDADGRLFDV